MSNQDAEARFAAVVELLRKPGPVNEDYVAPEVEACAQAGVADAMLLAASMAGAGWGCGQDWGAAIDWLVRAAEAGSAPARGQMRLLSGTDGDDWRAMADRIDVEAWVAARDARVIEPSPWIAMSENFIDLALCAWLIERAAPSQEAALVYDAVTGKAAERDARTNTSATFSLTEVDVPMLLLRERIANTLGAPVSHQENISVFHYVPGQRFTTHVDYLTPARDGAEIAAKGQRPYTFLIYLNDDFDAGETHFTELGRKLRGKSGEAVFWRNLLESGEPNPRTTHEGAPPTRGEKWVLSVFVRDKPQVFG
ncbi:MAG: 2OG-Fe(II) oxygenase [Proteobacteria bacterium]|nr:2OG-Fe(II) oxygenase [Pseudomonadota bacterium]